MLVLSRKSRESVVLGNGIERLLKVKVLEIKGQSVRLGFEVDPDVPVHGAFDPERSARDPPARGAA